MSWPRLVWNVVDRGTLEIGDKSADDKGARPAPVQIACVYKDCR
jgi:hypothetical protein